MQKLHYSIRINAPKEKVWDTMLDDATYREWTSAFMPGGYFEGSWDKGSKIRFLGPDKGGMTSEIAENKPHEFLSIRHLGIVTDGVEDTTGDEAKKWAGALENYTFHEENSVTEVLVDMDSDEAMVDDFNKMWPEGLAKLKELAEKQE